MGFKLYFDGHMEDLSYQTPEPNTSSYGYFKWMIEIARSFTPPRIKDVGITG